MKKILLALCFATILRAEPVTTTLLEDVKLELTKGKGSIVLKAGVVVEVVGRDGDSIAVIYRGLQGRLPANKTNYKGDVTKPATTESKPVPKSDAPAPPPPPAAAKPVETKPAPTPAEAPTSMHGKMVKKARDNEAKHKDNLVEPTDSVSGAEKTK